MEQEDIIEDALEIRLHEATRLSLDTNVMKCKSRIKNTHKIRTNLNYINALTMKSTQLLTSREQHRTTQRRRHDTTTKISILSNNNKYIHIRRQHASNKFYNQLLSYSLIQRCALMFISMLLISHSQTTNGLDSPVKIQRNKIQQQQQQFSNSTSNRAANDLDHPDNQLEQFNATFSLASNPNHKSSSDRVRRTNSEHYQVAQNINQPSSQQPECPSTRLIQSLLPSEYVGSPATSQRPSMARAHCECVPDSFGWHLTCFAGSSQATSGSGGYRDSSLSSNVMPNQLHPAFRNSQIARQQQQQQQQQNQANSNHLGRRSKRSPARWLGDDSDKLRVSTALRTGDENLSTTSHNNDELSPHEGFGEDASSSLSMSLQQPSLVQGNLQDAAERTTPAIFHKQANHLRSKSNLTGSNMSAPLDQGASSSLDRIITNNLRQDQYENSVNNNIKDFEDSTANEQPLRSSSSSNGDKFMLAAASNHLTFQTIPVLFSIKYLRNNMIEIDCDQAAPSYKAAMFRGK